MIKVVHCKVVQKHEYIGRPSVLGNPFTHKKGTKADIVVESREKAVAMYRDWILEQIKNGNQAIITELNRLKEIAIHGSLNLGCWCAPQACHGDVIKEILKDMIRRENMSKPTAKIIVAGSRTFKDYKLLRDKLDHLLKNKLLTHQIMIVSGTANGADKLGERYAKERGLKIISMPADWDQYGKSAGYRRNEEMANVADACVVFMEKDGTRGSQHMINIAKKKGLPLRVIRY